MDYLYLGLCWWLSDGLEVVSSPAFEEFDFGVEGTMPWVPSLMMMVVPSLNS